MGNDINTKMGVTGIAQYKQAMSQASQSVKTLDAALKLNEKQLQATGDKEVYMQQKSKLLQQQIAAQTNVVKQGQAALTAMEKQGVNPASAAYQKMSQQVLNAQTALLGMNQDLDSVGQSAEETAQKTDKLTDSLNGINKKVSFDAVLNGIGKITDGMEAAARKVESLARDVWDTMAMAASWADDELTLAAMYGLDVETLQEMQFAAKKAETTIDAIVKSQQKLKNNMVYGSDDINAAFKKLGVSIGYLTGKENQIEVFRDATDVFWEAGEALMAYGDEVERDAMAQKIFGTSWKELSVLFQNGRESFEANMNEAPKVAEENVNKLNDLSEALENLDAEYQATKNTIISELAPAFTEVGKTVTNLIRQFNDYLQTDEGKEKMEALGDAVTDLFTGLSDVDFSQAIETAGGILESITGALGWIKENWSDVVTGIEAIGGAFLALKAAEIVGTLVQGASALKNLIGGGSTAAGAATASSTAAGAAETAAITKVTTGSTLLDALGIGALFKTAKEASEELGTGLWGYLYKKDQMQQMQLIPVMPSGEPHRTRNITGTAPDESMKGTVENLYNELYKAISSYSPELEGAPSMVDFYKNVLEPKVEDFAALQGVAEEDMQSIKNVFIDAFARSFEDDWEGTTGGLLNILQEAIDEKAQGLKVETTPELPADAETILQGELNGMGLTVPVMPDLSSIDGSHANGLPFVPFDGYIAALHRGERVVPATQNKNYNFTNNNYFDRTQLNNGTDVNGLAARIAEHNRRTLAGFGG